MSKKIGFKLITDWSGKDTGGIKLDMFETEDETKERIEQEARAFVEEHFPDWKAWCTTCNGLNCKNNKTCIHCDCQM